MYLDPCIFIAQVYVASILILQSQGYVLLAANLDDFKTIAKKFVPEQLAEKIAELAANPKSQNNEQTGITPSESEEDTSNLRAKENTKIAHYNFEELVEKVKERLQKDIIEKVIKDQNTKETNRVQSKPKIVSNKGKYLGSKDPTPEYYEEDEKPTKQEVRERLLQFAVKNQERENHKPMHEQNRFKNKVNAHFNKEDESVEHKYSSREEPQYEKPTTKQTKELHRQKKDFRPVATQKNSIEEMVYYENVGEEYNNNNYEEKGAQNDSGGKMLTKVEMLAKNDSYEDYVIPAREEDIFESDSEVKNKKLSLVRLSHAVQALSAKSPDKVRVVPTTTKKSVDVQEYIVDTEEVIEKSDELRAQTEDLWFDDKLNTKATEDEVDETPVTKTSPKKTGTMIPKRDYFKMSSPNYVVKIPVAAEKYDFNEPLPERDREPENRKPLPSVPSVINGKVKV